VTTYVAFMRAVNVAGHAVVRMEALRGAFAAAGCENVRTFIQSGNVVFDSRRRDEEAVLQALRAELYFLLGVEPGVFLRTLAEMAQLVSRDPFSAFSAEANVKLYVVFLSQQPKIRPRLPLLLPKEGLEAFGISGREVFVVSRPNPKGFYGFPNNFIEKELSVSATSRNWNTVSKIVKLAASPQD
jgi:uncharacterized protein (DUF1697 family)